MWNVAVSIPCADRPVHRSVEHGCVVSIHSEDEAAIHHHVVVVEAPDGGAVVAVEVLELPLLAQVLRAERFKPHEETAQPGRGSLLEQPGAQHRWHRARGLPHPVHSPHPLEERGREAHVAEEMIVEEVEVLSGESVDLGKRVIHRLGVEPFPALEEGFLVAEVA